MVQCSHIRRAFNLLRLSYAYSTKENNVVYTTAYSGKQVWSAHEMGDMNPLYPQMYSALIPFYSGSILLLQLYLLFKNKYFFYEK